MEFLVGSLINLLLIFIFVCEGITLHCRYCNYGRTIGTDFEESCDLLIHQISSDFEGHRFDFSGVTTEQKLLVKTLIFRNSSIAFVPKEAFTTFPNLERITMLNTSLGTLEYDWLKNFLKYAKNIKYLDFRWNKINKTEPRVLEIFSKYERVNLRWNLCVDRKFEIYNGDVSRMRADLDNCFNYYFSEGGFYLAGLKTIKLEKKIEKSLTEIQELKGQIAELKKMVEKFAKNC